MKRIKIKGSATLGSSSLEEWLEGLRQGRADIIDFSFPSDQIKIEYLAKIETRTDEEIVSLLRKFLIPSGSLGSDKTAIYWLLHLLESGQLKSCSEYQSRLLKYTQTGGRRRTPPPWEGITWILDLLPHNPRGAISALDAYLEAHCMVMPDGRIHGTSDAIEIIRAKYIERPRSPDDAIRLLLDELPRTFEHLVERLYAEMGYATSLTPNQKDGGYDVLATKGKPGQRARLHIECKRWEGKVSVEVIRALLGVVADSKATNGICVTTSDLTAPAKEFVARNAQLDYLCGADLIRLMNEYLGPTWYYSIERLVRESRTNVVTS